MKDLWTFDIFDIIVALAFFICRKARPWHFRKNGLVVQKFDIYSRSSLHYLYISTYLKEQPHLTLSKHGMLAIFDKKESFFPCSFINQMNKKDENVGVYFPYNHNRCRSVQTVNLSERIFPEKRRINKKKCGFQGH